MSVNLELKDMLMISEMAPKAIVIISNQKWRNTALVLEKGIWTVLLHVRGILKQAKRSEWREF